MDRARRKEQADRAYDIQVRAGAMGAIKATAYGIAAATFAHYTWPLFRRQTLAFKGFLVSACTIFGLVVGADKALLSHEADHRIAEERLRRVARIGLAREGRMASEPEIAAWIARREAVREKEIKERDGTEEPLSSSP